MSDLNTLFYWQGVADSFINFKGQHTVIPYENRCKLLAAMGIDLSSDEAIAKETERVDVEPWRHWLQPFAICPESSPFFEIRVAAEERDDCFEWQIFDENNQIIASEQFVPSAHEQTGDYYFYTESYSRHRITLPALPIGYLSISVRCDNNTHRVTSKTATLAVTPKTTFIPEWSHTNDKLWGTIIHLYTLRSNRNWGMGDFTDLRELINFVHQQGGDLIGLNPLHALCPNLQQSFSPYTPSDRRFINALYIDPELEPEFSQLNISKTRQKAIQILRQQPHVRYAQIADIKLPVLLEMFQIFCQQELEQQSSRATDFIQFIDQKKQALLPFSIYEYQHQQWAGKPDLVNESDLDFFIHSSIDTQLTSVVETSYRSILFYCYLQWIAENQLNSCQTLAKNLGMKLGLIKDLAVGADGSGAEVSTNPDLFCKTTSIGAPPDPLALTGQNWGIPPMKPDVLKASGYEHYIQLLRANMAGAGALRIDHAMSLMRLWWCPPNEQAAQGGYIYYDLDAMLGLLCLESQRQQCAIVGEDLGVVTDEFRHAITQAKVFSNKVFYFEKQSDDQFKHPSDYQIHALAMVNNHDVPTLLSWWNASDLELRNQLNLLEPDTPFEQVLAHRHAEKQSIIRHLSDTGLMPSSWINKDLSAPADRDLIEAILLLAGQAQSQIFVLQLEDLMLMDAPVNVPGTFREYPNWQRKLTISTEQLTEQPRVLSLLNRLSKQRMALA